MTHFRLVWRVMSREHIQVNQITLCLTHREAAMQRATLVALAAIVTVACGGSSPNSPTPLASANHWTIGGIIRSTGTPIVGASVRVLDGANAGKTATTDAGGRYVLAGLEQGGFTIQVSATGYLTTTKS